MSHTRHRRILGGTVMTDAWFTMRNPLWYSQYWSSAQGIHQY